MFKSYFQKTTTKKAGKVRNTMKIKQEKGNINIKKVNFS